MTVRPRLEVLEARLVPTVYDVGPGFLPNLASVPWNSLMPGDRVQIHWQSQAYHEKIQIARSGTASQHIQIVGIMGPDGQLPVIDGDLAHDVPALYYTGTSLDAYGVIVVAPHGDEGDNYKVRYVDIEGLEIQDGSNDYSYYTPNGRNFPYIEAAGGVSMYYASNISIINCNIHDNGNGIFGKSFGYSQNLNNILIQGNTVQLNGYLGDERHHNIYIEGDHVTYQYNTILDPYGGSGIKDRSAGAIIRYNWIQGGEHMLDLVDPEDAPDLASKPEFQDTYVYGNVFVDDCWYSAPIHFGGDSGDTRIYRPNLIFYFNTVVMFNDQPANWRIDMFRADTNGQTIYLYNNIFANFTDVDGLPPSELRLIGSQGNLVLGANWVPGDTMGMAEDGFTGSITGENNLVWGDDPGFVDVANGDFHLRPDSQAIGAATPIDPLFSGWPVLYEYIWGSSKGHRRSNTSDLGAYAFKP
jgi:hypothetical protein